LLDLQLLPRDAGSQDLRDPLALRGLRQASAELLQRLLDSYGGLMCGFEAVAKAMTWDGQEDASLTRRANMLAVVVDRDVDHKYLGSKRRTFGVLLAHFGRQRQTGRYFPQSAQRCAARLGKARPKPVAVRRTLFGPG